VRAVLANGGEIILTARSASFDYSADAYPSSRRLFLFFFGAGGNMLRTFPFLYVNGELGDLMRTIRDVVARRRVLAGFP